MVEREGQRDALQRLADISASIAIAGAVTYIVGLGALLVPLRRDLLGDLDTAFFAVSLVPRASVVWRGAVGVLLPALVLTCFLVGIRYIPSLVRYLLDRGRAFLLTLVIVGLEVVFLVLLAGVMLGGVYTPSVVKQQPCLWCLFIAISSLVGAAVTAFFALRYMNRLDARSGSNLRITSTLLVFGVAFIAALPYVVFKPLPLPGVELGRVSGSEVVVTQAEVEFSEGALLVNSEGGWYILRLEPNGKSPILFVPNAQIETACVWEVWNKDIFNRVTNESRDC